MHNFFEILYFNTEDTFDVSRIIANSMHKMPQNILFRKYNFIYLFLKAATSSSIFGCK